MLGPIMDHYIRTAYAAEVLADSPRAYWRMGDGGSGTMADSSGNGRSGSYSGGGHVKPVTGLLVGDPNTAVNFNGSTSYATVASNAWMDMTTITVEAWVKLDATTAILIEIANRDQGNFTGSNKRCWQLRINAASRASFLVYWAAVTGSFAQAAGTSAITGGTIAHLVGTYDGTNVKIYRDAVLETTTAAAGAIPTGVGGPVIVAKDASSPTQFLDGTIDEIAIYNGALSPARILAHYQAGMGIN